MATPPPDAPSDAPSDDAAPRPGALELLTALVRDAPVGFAFLDPDYRYRIINHRLAELNDIEREAHLGRRVEDMHPHLWPRLKPIYDRVRETLEPAIDIPISGRVGSRSEERHWISNYFPVLGDDEEFLGIGLVVVETTQQVKAEQEVRRLAEREHQALEDVRASEENLRAIVAAIPDYIFNLDAEGTHLGVHTTRLHELRLAPEDFLGKRIRDVLPEVADPYEDAIAEALETGTTQTFEYTLGYDDAVRDFEARLVPKGDGEIVASVRDMTQMKALEAKFRQAQKMEAVGRLAGGVAHDFNNLLTVINASAELLLTDDGSDDRRDLLEEIREAGERASRLTEQLLLFTRQQLVEPRVVDLNAVVHSAQRMLLRLLGEHVLLTTRLDPDLPQVVIDPGQVEQVLVNLSVNARDAMPDGGRLTITTEAVDPPGEAADGAGPWALLRVDDEGVGMDPETVDRIFEPFFTTKPPGEGSGLGLAVVFGVVEDSGGEIQVRTEPGDGTTFEICLPGASGSEPADDAATVPELPRGSETILVVEDDEPVRRVIRRSLERLGYTLLVAPDGREALGALQNAEGPIHLLLSDVVMPHMGGRELSERIRELHPEVGVLLMSGYTDDQVIRQGVRDADVAFLQKPFTATELSWSVREALDRGDG